MGRFSTMLKQLRNSRHLTQEDLSKRLDLSRSRIGMYESGRREPDFETLELLADFFNVDTDYLLGRTDKTTLLPNSAAGIAAHSRVGVAINVYGKVAAGIPLEMIEDIIDTEEIPEEMARSGAFFGLRIKGDSMEPKILDGDVVIVRQQSDAESGETVIATINGDSATCKRLKKYNEGIALISINPKYEPMYFSNKEALDKPVRILGKVVELRRKL